MIVSLETDTGEAPLIVERSGESVGMLSVPCQSHATFAVPDGLICIVYGDLWVVDTRGTLDNGTRLATYAPSFRIIGVDTHSDCYSPYEGWANLSPNMSVRPTAGATPSGNPAPPRDISLDLNMLVALGTQAAQTPVAPTPNSVVTLAAPGQ